MSIKRSSLPNTYFSGLDYNNIIKDIQNMVKNHPEYNSSWDDFLNSNAGVMITSMFAMITDQLASRIDMSVDELLLDTFTKKDSAIKLLKLIGYSFSLPYAARVKISAESTSVAEGNINIKNEYIPGDKKSFNPKVIFGVDKDGNYVPFESLKYDEVSNEYDYFSGINQDLNSDDKVDYFHGTTKILDVEVTEDSGFYVNLSESPVDGRSVQVFLLDEEEKERGLLKVPNFIVEESQNINNPIPWSLEVNEDDTAKIVFASSELVVNPDKRPTIGSTLRIFYRVGGGIQANVNRNAINVSDEVVINGESHSINFINKEEGIGGTNSETAEHAAYHGPRVTRTAGKTVTIEDYESILDSNVNILKNKTYGADNIPHNYYEKYGLLLNPLEVLNFILMKKPGWDTRKTKDYYLSNWGTLNVENRFNGLYGFFDSEFGEKTDVNRDYLNKESEEGILISEDSLYHPKNYTVINTSDKFKESLVVDEVSMMPNEDFLASITLTEFDKNIHRKIDDIEDDFFGYKDNYFVSSSVIKHQVFKNINAYVYSIDITNGVSLISNANKFLLSLDSFVNDLEYQVTLDLQEITPTTPGVITPQELSDYINTKVASIYGDINPYQDFGLVISDEEDEFAVPIENLDEDVYKFVIFNGTAEVTYDLNLGTVQTWSSFLQEINNKIGVDEYEASIIQSYDNIACKDIRVEYVGIDGFGVEFRHYVNPDKDIFELLEISLEESSPVTSADYSQISSVEEVNGRKYLKIESPTWGVLSVINIERHPLEDCINRIYPVRLLEGEQSFVSYGERKATIILESEEDEELNNFGKILFENGSRFISPWDKDYFYLNYIIEQKDTINLGNYFYENFDVSDSRHKSIDFGIYNSKYEYDEIGTKYFIDLEKSDILLHFSTEEEKRISSFWKLNSSLENFFDLDKSSPPYVLTNKITNIELLKNKKLKIETEVNEYVFEFLEIDTLSSFVQKINTQISELTVTIKDNKIEITSENYKNGVIRFKSMVDTFHHLLFDNSEESSDVEFLVNGDYYLEYDSDMTERGGIKMKLTNFRDNIPQFKFYIHYLSDRRFSFDQTVGKFETDEDYLHSFLNPYKITGIENTFKIPRFSTFDVISDVVIYSNFSPDRVRENIVSAIKERFSLGNMEISDNINKSELLKIIMDVDGVRYSDIKYFGREMTDQSSNEDSEIFCDFDEIIVVSDDELVSGVMVHGVMINITRM